MFLILSFMFFFYKIGELEGPTGSGDVGVMVGPGGSGEVAWRKG
jgi:hypothetical protein